MRQDFLGRVLSGSGRSGGRRVRLEAGVLRAIGQWTLFRDCFIMIPVMRILVVEDDKKIASFVVNGLKQSGYAVDHASEGEDGLFRAQTIPYDAAVVDVMLPKLDGLKLIQQLRAHGARMPALILSAKRTVDDRVRGLQAGGDDYLTKPFDFAELLARVQALIRRSTGAVEPTRLTVGDLSMDLLTRRVQRGAAAIDLRPR